MDDVYSKITAIARQSDIEGMSLQELADKAGLKYRSQAKHYKEKAEKDGLLVRNSLGKLVPAPSANAPSMITLPVMGEANCGPALSYANDTVTGSLSFSQSILRRQLSRHAFAVRARGNSMDMANINGNPINDGDLAIVEPLDWAMAADKDYVLSVIDGVANIKRLHIDAPNRRIILRSESRDIFEDIIIGVEDIYMYKIAGRVIAVVKG